MGLPEFGWMFTGGLVVFCAMAFLWIMFEPYHLGWESGYDVGYDRGWADCVHMYDGIARENPHNADSGDVIEPLVVSDIPWESTGTPPIDEAT